MRRSDNGGSLHAIRATVEFTQEVVTCICIDFGLVVMPMNSKHFEAQIGRIVLDAGMVGDVVKKLLTALNGALHEPVHVLDRNARVLTRILKLSENVDLHGADILASSIVGII